MSYSRWSNSVWYTYWCSSDAKKREDEVFDVCGERSFTYQELTEDIDKCLELIKNDKDKGSVTQEELDELKGYMLEFIEDVKKEYITPSERYRKGEIDLDDAFIEEIG
jgi:hypothetical protein